jgi:putative transposase
VFPNHYHFVGTPSAGGRPLGDVINELHAVTARELNRYDGSPGRKVWFQFWDTRLTYAASYYARLRYVMYNPVKHGVVTDETAYPWGCAAWFARNLEPARLRRLRSYRCDRLDVFEPL